MHQSRLGANCLLLACRVYCAAKNANCRKPADRKDLNLPDRRLECVVDASIAA